jgi:hypothetical protein
MVGALLQKMGGLSIADACVMSIRWRNRNVTNEQTRSALLAHAADLSRTKVGQLDRTGDTLYVTTMPFFDPIHTSGANLKNLGHDHKTILYMAAIINITLGFKQISN